MEFLLFLFGVGLGMLILVVAQEIKFRRFHDEHPTSPINDTPFSGLRELLGRRRTE